MKKIIILAAALLSFSFGASAQNSSNNASATASQNVQLNLSNALEITFSSNNSATGAAVALPFTSVSDYANGVESAAQQIRVRSNKDFNVTVKSAAANFTGTNGGVANMPVQGVLDIKVTANNTGGTVATAFSSYGDLTATAQNLITNGDRGGNQTFSVQYKATPGFAYPAGTYTTDVIYTATQQ